MIKGFLQKLAYRFSNWGEILAGIALTTIMLLTGCDIVGRIFGMPIPGTYEIVSFAGGLVIGLAVPITSLTGGHVKVDLLLDIMSKRQRSVFHVITRLMGMAIFLITACSLIIMGTHIRSSGLVSATLNFPVYPVAYAMGGAFFVEVLVLAADLIRTEELKHE